MNDDKRLDRLPKWAQDEILNLRRNVEHWQRRAGFTEPQEVATTPAIIVDPYATFTGGPVRTVRMVEPYSTIRFQVSQRFHLDARFSSQKLEAGALLIHGSDAIIVEPQASNVIALWPKRLEAGE